MSAHLVEVCTLGIRYFFFGAITIRMICLKTIYLSCAHVIIRKKCVVVVIERKNKTEKTFENVERENRARENHIQHTHTSSIQQKLRKELWVDFIAAVTVAKHTPNVCWIQNNGLSQFIGESIVKNDRLKTEKKVVPECVYWLCPKYKKTHTTI